MPNTNLEEDDEQDQPVTDEQQGPSSSQFITPQQWGPGLMPQPQQLNIPSDQPAQAAPAPGPVTPPQDFSQTHGFKYIGANPPPPGVVLPPERMAGDIGPNAAAYARYRATLRCEAGRQNVPKASPAFLLRNRSPRFGRK